MYVFELFVTPHFLVKILATVSSENTKKFEVIGNDKTIHLSTQFLMLIPNIVVLLHKSWSLMIKNENYYQKTSFSGQNLVKTIFLNTRKKRKKSGL